MPATFDAFLYQPTQNFDPLMLKIKLKINMRPMAQRLLPFVLDANKRPFWSTPWMAADWQRYISAAITQANMRNNRFRLVPPPIFVEFDQSIPASFPGQVWRPNIRFSEHRSASLPVASSASSRSITSSRRNTCLQNFAAEEIPPSAMV